MNLQKKFYVAMGMLAVLALLAWITLNDGTVVHIPIPVGWDSYHRTPVMADTAMRLRTMTLAVLGMFALRAWLHWRAEKIREEREQHDEVSS
jgi:hypothetical protein